jgi:hypothetical protein
MSELYAEVYEAGSPLFDYELELMRSGLLRVIGDHFIPPDIPDGGEFAVLHPDKEPPGEGEISLELPRYAGESVLAMAQAV